MLDIYDSQLGMVRIGPFNYDPLRGVNLWLSQSDDFLLNHLSTSPEVEPPHFVMEVCVRSVVQQAAAGSESTNQHIPLFCRQLRSTLRYIEQNQFPAVTVFRDNRPHYFQRDEMTGCWAQTRYP